MCFRIALIQIAAPFGVGLFIKSTPQLSFRVLRCLARPFICSIRQCYNQSELSAVITPFSCTAGFFCRRDVAQPGRALAWGARGRQFKSARPDHSFLSPTKYMLAIRPLLPDREHPKSHRGEAQRRRANKSVRGAAARADSRPFKSARPDHYLSCENTVIQTALTAVS